MRARFRPCDKVSKSAAIARMSSTSKSNQILYFWQNIIMVREHPLENILLRRQALCFSCRVSKIRGRRFLLPFFFYLTKKRSIVGKVHFALKMKMKKGGVEARRRSYKVILVEVDNPLDKVPRRGQCPLPPSNSLY